ncbi:Hypothetical predicted protein [Pelobates cultripes]|uniref:Shelterin complex subunit TPP1/Est3 domain-containing protein n=1 Tax=Pelobates cultripes TaxID=61616 RepID=A0AAD1S0G4_PELCU|nr:Hypothetical predicted protein [Pelobates cultripes]
MRPQHSIIGHPWILDAIAKYDSRNHKNKPVPAQVVEFVKMPSSSTNDPEDPAAVVHISDRKYYIRAIITKEAQETMERESDHFTLARVKNKIIILKNYTVCFTELEDLRACEFYITVHYFTMIPMETNSVDLLNCNMDPGVHKKIKELWQNYMAELAVKECSQDVSLTQLLNIANEDKLNALKSLAEECLDLGKTNQETQQAITKWGTESFKNKDNSNRFTVSMNDLLIPPNEEDALNQMKEFTNAIDVTSDPEDSIDEVHTSGESSLPYSTALSSENEEPYCDVLETQLGNPWNKLQSLCVSLSSGSASQTKESSPFVPQSSEEDIFVDPDSSTPDLCLLHVDDPAAKDVPKNVDENSPLIFSDSLTDQDPSEQHDKILCNSMSLLDGNTTLMCVQKKHSNVQSSPISPVRQLRSPQSQLSEIKQGKMNSTMSPCIESEVSLRKVRCLVFPTEVRSEDSESRGALFTTRSRKAIKRKQISEDSDVTSTDFNKMNNQLESAHKEGPNNKKDCVTVKSTGEKHTSVNDKEIENNMNERTNFGIELNSYFENELEKQEQVVRKINIRKSKECINTLVKKKQEPYLSSFTARTIHCLNKDRENEVVSTGSIASNQNNHVGETTNEERTKAQGCKVMKTTPVIDPNTSNVIHYDGTHFQYKYKPPSADLCTRVNSIRLPSDLYQWAVKILSETQEEVP